MLAWYEVDNVNRRLLQMMSVCVSYLIRIVTCNLQHLIFDIDGPDFSRYVLFPTYIYICIYTCSICIHDYSTYVYNIPRIQVHFSFLAFRSKRKPPWRINEFHCCYGLSRLVRQWWGLPGGHRLVVTN